MNIKSLTISENFSLMRRTIHTHEKFENKVTFDHLLFLGFHLSLSFHPRVSQGKVIFPSNMLSMASEKISFVSSSVFCYVRWKWWPGQQRFLGAILCLQLWTVLIIGIARYSISWLVCSAYKKTCHCKEEIMQFNGQMHVTDREYGSIIKLCRLLSTLQVSYLKMWLFGRQASNKGFSTFFLISTNNNYFGDFEITLDYKKSAIEFISFFYIVLMWCT